MSSDLIETLEVENRMLRARIARMDRESEDRRGKARPKVSEYDRAAMQMALEALQRSNSSLGEYPADTWPLTMQDNEEAITALREALTQPQGEWVDLTESERRLVFNEYHNAYGYRTKSGYSDALIAKFKEKNTPKVVPQGEPVAWPMQGVRVEGDTVIIKVKGGNEAARWLCGEILRAKGQP